MMNNYNDFYNNINRNANMYELETDPYNAFIKGNAFKNLYKGYKNYKPYQINPRNEKEYSLLLIQTYGFIAHDLGLYLDVNPNDEEIIKLRDRYNTMHKKAIMEYEQKYGALCLDSDMLGTVPWSWDANNFPWEGDK